MRLYILLIITISIILSCEKSGVNDNEESCSVVNLSDTVTYTIESKWNFMGFKSHQTGSEEWVPENIIGMSITFNQNNRFSAKSSCNGLGGYYAISEPDSIQIDSIFSTLIYCINDTIRAWETKFTAGLLDATKFNIMGYRLMIETSTDIDMIFRWNFGGSKPGYN